MNLSLKFKSEEGNVPKFSYLKKVLYFQMFFKWEIKPSMLKITLFNLHETQ